MDRNSKHKLLNDESAATCGFLSVKNGIGRSIAENLTFRSAERISNNDLDVVKSKQIKILEEPISYKNHASIEGLAIKVPWYNAKDEIIGIFGCSIVYGVHSIPGFLNQIMMLDLLRSSNDTIYMFSTMNGIPITKRERDVLKNTVKGKSAKELGSILNLSKKTIEYHIDNLKLKFGCSSKSELIEMIMNNLINIS